MGPRIDHYDWPGGREALLRFGPDDGPVVVAILPLFEEANRTRTFAVTLLRALARHGIAGWLPDLPGQGESLVPPGALSLHHMAAALAALTDTPVRRAYALGIRSGALLDGGARHAGRYHLAPQSGDELLRELHRTWRAAGATGDCDAMLRGDDPVGIAGTPLPRDLLNALIDARPRDAPGIPRRIVRLAGDPRPADRTIDAAPLWRRVEPGNDPALAATLAADIAAWIAACEA